jgi:kynureninase
MGTGFRLFLTAGCRYDSIGRNPAVSANLSAAPDPDPRRISVNIPIEPTASCAQTLDRNDPLAPFRDRFHLLPDTIYMDGNSLGLLSKEAEASLLATLETWKKRGVNGWFEGDGAWLDSAGQIGGLSAGMMGAAPDQVVHSATVTVNIHALLASFYQPRDRRVKILADELNFPTDIYALKGQLAIRGRSVAEDLVFAPSTDGRTLDEDTIAAMFTDEIAVAWLPSVLYRSGQLLDMAYLTRQAHARGILIGFDCCHSAGIVPHELDRWGVDFAVWCGYKYLNSGPGGSAFLYVNRRHFAREPVLTGWFGNRRETMFDMSHEFEAGSGAGRWQISSPGILGSSTLRGSLALINEAGIDNIRAKSLAMTGYLMALLDEHLAGPPYDFKVGTPREARRRGGHVAVERAVAAGGVCDALIARGVVPDFRPPNVIRICPSPLYGTFDEIWQTVTHLKAIIAGGEHLAAR